MASRRQRLSQRRKAVGLTQESLAERLGVERSTIVRWEAGDTEPLPSIRPSLASALDVSLDQLAELLTSAEDTVPVQAPPASTGVAAPELLADVAPQGQPAWAQAEQLVRPRAAETVEALRRTLRSAEVSPAYVDALLLVCGVSRAPLVTQLLAGELGGSDAVRADPQAAIALSGLAGKAVHPARVSIASTDVRLDTLIPATAGVAAAAVPEPAPLEGASRPPLATPLPWYRATPRKYQRFAAAGVLVLAGVIAGVLVGAAASVPLVSSPHAATPPAATGPAAPGQAGAAIPVPGPSSHNGDIPRSQEPIGAAPAAPAEPGHLTGSSAPQQAAAAPAPRATRASSGNRPTSRSAQPAAKTPHPRAAQAQAWAHEAAHNAREQAARLRSQPPPRP